MSKFLKFIVNLFLVLAIVVTAGIIIPPLLGVSTTIVDSASMDTNLPLGSVTYSRDKAVLDLAAGDEILKESGSSTYAYIVQEGDAATGEFTVVSATEPNASPETIVIRNNVSEVVLTVPYIGFVVVAMQSLEGRIIIALVILFIIILFILSELWKKRDDEDEEDEDDMAPPSGTPGNAPAASAEAAGDAGEKLRKSDAENTRYSENVKDNRGYGTVVSQDTASITAAMAGVAARTDTASAEEEEEAEAEVVSPAEEAETYEAGDTAEISVATPAAANEMPNEPEMALGDTKVFPGPIDPQMIPDEGAAEKTAANAEETITYEAQPAAGEEESEDSMTAALIAETEKAAASWSGLRRDEEDEPKLLWSWTDEPFENEIDGEVWNGIQTGRRADIDDIPERFAPVERMTRQEILTEAKSGGSDPKVLRDDVTGIDIIDFSDLL